MIATQQQSMHTEQSENPGAEGARKQRLRFIVIGVVAACGVLTLVGGTLNLLGN
jgi:hypothetical protein